MKKKDEPINWKVYPTKIVEQVAKEHNIEIGNFLYQFACGTLSKEILNELEEKSKNVKRKPNEV